MPDLMEPDHDHAEQKQGHRRRATDSLGDAVGGVFETQELFAVFKRTFDGPPIGVGGEDLANAPSKIGAVEPLIGPFAERVADEHDGQQSTASRFVVQGLLGFHLQGGVQAERIEFEFFSTACWRRQPIRSCRVSGGLFFEGHPCGP